MALPNRAHWEAVKAFLLRDWAPLVLFLTILLFTSFWRIVPRPLFRTESSLVITDREGQLLTARVARDGQYRFPPMQQLPFRYKAALIHFEDEYFYYHPGVNPISAVKALGQNRARGNRRRGASTITMQLARLTHPGRQRNWGVKILETLQALRLELTLSKEEILCLYASHAPFGGNVVGLETAAWRYYGSSPWQLGWGQMAALAVLPNAPSAVYPGKGHAALIAKRNALLRKLLNRGIIDSLQYSLALEEELPSPANAMPQWAAHLESHIIKDAISPEKTIQTTISLPLQQAAERVVSTQAKALSENRTHNVAALIVEVNSGEVLAYIGNRPELTQSQQGYVNNIISPRSTASLLKPFLYAAMLDRGDLLPHQLVPDIPTQYRDYSPSNASGLYEGAVPASTALAASLNVPSVRMLKQFGTHNFLQMLRDLGLNTLQHEADHYGLSLILGGGECTLWDITAAYAALPRMLNMACNQRDSKGSTIEPLQEKLTYLLHPDLHQTAEHTRQSLSMTLQPGAIYCTLRALTTLSRPTEERGWKNFNSSQPIAWKTGTSHGAKDAWAVGVTSQYAIGVWVGNSSGRGQQGISGVQSAAPILFSLLKLLPPCPPFPEPSHDLIKRRVCAVSGFPAGPDCPRIVENITPKRELTVPSCPYHAQHFLNQEGTHRVHANCYPRERMQRVLFFTLPPLQAFYYQRAHPEYSPLPPWLPGCEPDQREQPIDFVYPTLQRAKLSTPRNLKGEVSPIVFHATHSLPQATLFWHLDGQYIGSTKMEHQMRLTPTEGEHLITLVDEQGNSKTLRFSLLYTGER